MNFKRGRARNRRSGCKLCKPWKVNGYRTESLQGEKLSDHRRRLIALEEIKLYKKEMSYANSGTD